MLVQLRFPQPADLEQIEALFQQVQQLHVEMRPDIYKPVERMMTEETLQEVIENKTAIVAAAEDDVTVIGYADWMIREYKSLTHVERRVLFVDTMVVDEKYRHMGIGGCMFDQIREYASEWELDGIELQVNAKNAAAKQMYEKYGFTEKSINMEIKL